MEVIEMQSVWARKSVLRLDMWGAPCSASHLLPCPVLSSTESMMAKNGGDSRPGLVCWFRCRLLVFGRAAVRAEVMPRWLVVCWSMELVGGTEWGPAKGSRADGLEP